MGIAIERALSGFIRPSWQAEAAHSDCSFVSKAQQTALSTPDHRDRRRYDPDCPWPRRLPCLLSALELLNERAQDLAQAVTAAGGMSGLASAAKMDTGKTIEAVRGSPRLVITVLRSTV